MKKEYKINHHNNLKDNKLLIMNLVNWKIIAYIKTIVIIKTKVLWALIKSKEICLKPVFQQLILLF